MRNKLLPALVTALVLLPWHSLYGAPAGSAEPGWGWMEGLGRFFNLLVLFGLIYYFAREPVKQFFRDRRLGIQAEIQEARRISQEAESKLAEIEQKMSTLDRELASLREEAEGEAALERRRILEEAERDAEKILAAGRREVDGLTRLARKQLKEYAAQLAVELAAGQIRKEMSEQDETRVVERFFVALSGASKKGK